MSDALAAMQVVLEASVARQGEKPLTNAYLLNIVKMTRRVQRRRDEARATEEARILNEVLNEDRIYGGG